MAAVTHIIEFTNSIFEFENKIKMSDNHQLSIKNKESSKTLHPVKTWRIYNTTTVDKKIVK